MCRLQERLNEKRREREAQEKKEALEKEIRRRKAGQEVNQMREELVSYKLNKIVSVSISSICLNYNGI